MTAACDHDCLDHLQYRQHDWVEPHGEQCRDEWWECGICGEKFTKDDLAR